MSPFSRRRWLQAAAASVAGMASRLPAADRARRKALRIQLRDETGQWIDMPDYVEIGAPHFSRDGQRIVFDGYQDGYNYSRGACWIVRRDGTGLRKLTDGATPRWSPDGESIIFMRDTPHYRGDDVGMYEIDPDGTGEQKIGPGRWPDWSSDGSKIVFSRSTYTGPRGGVRPNSTIYIAKADGSGPQKIVDGDCPTLSPDGKFLAFAVAAPAGKYVPFIWLLERQTRREWRIMQGWCRGNWAGDSRSFVFEAYDGRGRRAIVERILAGDVEPKPLHPQFAKVAAPDESRDGQYTVFVAER